MPRPAWADGSSSGVSACSDSLVRGPAVPAHGANLCTSAPRQPQDACGWPAGTLELTACPAEPQAAHPGRGELCALLHGAPPPPHPPPFSPRAAAEPLGLLCSKACVACKQVRRAAGCYAQGGADAGREHKAAVWGDQRQDGLGQQRRQGHRAGLAAVGVCVCVALSSYICMCAERARRLLSTRAGRPPRRVRSGAVRWPGAPCALPWQILVTQ